MGYPDKKKELKQSYRQKPEAMGVYQIRNVVNERVFVGAALNLYGIINRHKFDLKLGSHRNEKLQADWLAFGGESFAFEILDELTPKDGSGRDYKAELAVLEELWLAKLQPYGDVGYNERKKGREEMLRHIAANRSGDR